MMEKVSVQELTAVLVVKHGLKKKEAERFVTTVFEVVKDALATDRTVKIKGLGTFKVVDVEPRESVDVTTGERVLIEGHAKITFTPDVAMKELVNKPFSQFETVVLNDGVEFDELQDDVQDDNEDELAEMPIVEENTPSVEEEEAEETELPILDVFDEPQGPQEEEQEAEAEETVDEDVATTADETEETEETADEEPLEDIEETETSGSKYLWIGLALVACVLSFCAGYMIGTRKAAPEVEVRDTIPVPTQTVQVKPDTATSAKPVAPPQAKPEQKPTPAPAKPTPAPAKPEPTPAPDASDVDYQKYEQMDGRVRTGAYRIVGTAQEVKVKEGETLLRISKRHLGPDMECYVEVYNGIKASTPLTVGQTIKIPKLERKKKKTQQTTNQE